MAGRNGGEGIGIHGDEEPDIAVLAGLPDDSSHPERPEHGAHHEGCEEKRLPEDGFWFLLIVHAIRIISPTA